MPFKTVDAIKADIAADNGVGNFTAWRQVKRGERVGVAGDTGQPGVTHLHFEVQRGGYPSHKTDPYDIYSTRDLYQTPSCTPGPLLVPGDGSLVLAPPDDQGQLWTQCPPALPPLSDRLFFSDFAAGTIVRVDLATQRSSVVVSGLDHPEDGVCGPISQPGFVYFAEPARQRILRFAEDGTDVTEVVHPSLGQSPEGPSFDVNGHLYFNTNFPATGVWRLTHVNPNDTPINVVPSFGGRGEGTVFLPNGDLLIADGLGGSVLRASPPDFGSVSLFRAGINFPIGLALNQKGEIFVSEGVFPGRILRFDVNGTLLGVVVTLHEEARHIDFDSHDNLYVGTTAGNVYRITPDGTRTAAARGGHIVGVAVCKN